MTTGRKRLVGYQAECITIWQMTGRVDYMGSALKCAQATGVKSKATVPPRTLETNTIQTRYIVQIKDARGSCSATVAKVMAVDNWNANTQK